MSKKKPNRYVGLSEQKESIYKPANKRVPTSRAKNGGNSNLEYIDYHRKQVQPATVKLKKQMNDYWGELPDE